ncbi:hypothetical protein BD626DRAFT_535520 [Schizophyllum amplum]|uniref:Uncharacterized protein n=1 Tax=Schizophyllum amplum TaxID=97359 RepID=A0A550CN08_9AGAR|nr:hypothetical protein BD626DRAFT_535520 [Auriculariopsis ampla]
MPAPLQSFDVLLDVVNDTQDNVTVQLERDYGVSGSAVALVRPAESLSLVLESGSVYRYAVKTQTRVANVTARGWRDMRLAVSGVFASAPPENRATPSPPANGVVVTRIWRDYRCSVYSARIGGSSAQ